jgi:hypothetical protein
MAAWRIVLVKQFQFTSLGVRKIAYFRAGDVSSFGESFSLSGEG